MSTIERFFTTTFTIQRFSWTNDSSASLASVTGFDGHIQQIESRLAENLGLRFTETFQVWCPQDTVVYENDRISDGTNTYIVKFVQDRNVGHNTHLELIVEMVRSEYA